MKEKEEAEENKSKKMGKKVRRRNGGTEKHGTRNLIHIEEDNSFYNAFNILMVTYGFKILFQ